MVTIRRIVIPLGTAAILAVGWHVASKDRDPPPAAPAKAEPRHPVHIRAPSGPPMINSGQVDIAGHPAKIGCATCHALRPDNSAIRQGSELKIFHQGLKFIHGQLTCLACHNPQDYNTLHLADRQALPYQRVMELCTQCHGPQARDYAHGAHGGMTGFWDLGRGPRQRNNCINCHDPHAPAYPRVMPVFPPRDRFEPVPRVPHAPSGGQS